MCLGPHVGGARRRSCAERAGCSVFVQVVQLKAFQKFSTTTEALAAATAIVDSKLGKGAHVYCRVSQAPIIAGADGRSYAWFAAQG